MKRLLLLLPFTAAVLFPAENSMPEYQTYYISGIAFDTKVYCADFAHVIEAQAKKIEALEAEIAGLRRQQQTFLQQQSEAAEQKAEKEKRQSIKTGTPTKSKIIISDKPIK
jgi:predicted phage tail protein